MPQTNETPAGKAGARSDLLGGWSQETSNPAASRMQFTNHRQAALTLLNDNDNCPLTRAAGRFLGQLAVDSTPLSAKQSAWLEQLLGKHGLPPLARGVEQ